MRVEALGGPLCGDDLEVPHLAPPFAKLAMRVVLVDEEADRRYDLGWHRYAKAQLTRPQFAGEIVYAYMGPADAPAPDDTQLERRDE